VSVRTGTVSVLARSATVRRAESPPASVSEGVRPPWPPARRPFWRRRHDPSCCRDLP